MNSDGVRGLRLLELIRFNVNPLSKSTVKKTSNSKLRKKSTATIPPTIVPLRKMLS